MAAAAYSTSYTEAATTAVAQTAGAGSMRAAEGVMYGRALRSAGAAAPQAAAAAAEQLHASRRTSAGAPHSHTPVGERWNRSWGAGGTWGGGACGVGSGSGSGGSIRRPSLDTDSGLDIALDVVEDEIFVGGVPLGAGGGGGVGGGGSKTHPGNDQHSTHPGGFLHAHRPPEFSDPYRSEVKRSRHGGKGGVGGVVGGVVGGLQHTLLSEEEYTDHDNASVWMDTLDAAMLPNPKPPPIWDLSTQDFVNVLVQSYDGTGAMPAADTTAAALHGGMDELRAVLSGLREEQLALTGNDIGQVVRPTILMTHPLCFRLTREH